MTDLDSLLPCAMKAIDIAKDIAGNPCTGYLES